MVLGCFFSASNFLCGRKREENLTYSANAKMPTFTYKRQAAAGKRGKWRENRGRETRTAFAGCRLPILRESRHFRVCRIRGILFYVTSVCGNKNPKTIFRRVKKGKLRFYGYRLFITRTGGSVGGREFNSGWINTQGL